MDEPIITLADNSVPERNRKMFYWIADVIESYPEHHDQDSWYNESEAPMTDLILAGKEVNVCGTSQCIAGWAAVYDGRSYLNNSGILKFDTTIDGNDVAWYTLGINLLGINGNEADRLFNACAAPVNGDWPTALRAIGDGANIHDTIYIMDDEECNVD